MTLGGLALAVGILVDDATVTIENIERHLHMGSDLHKAILEGAGEIAVPALVSTLCICIVFVPMFFLTGVARYLFAPLAEAVVFAMLASYVLSRTLVPTLVMLMMDHAPGGVERPSEFAAARCTARFNARFERIRGGYSVILSAVLAQAPPVRRRISGFLRAVVLPGVHPRPRFLPQRGRRPDPAAHASADGNAHRGDGAGGRRGGARDPHHRAARGSRHGARQSRRRGQRHQQDLQQCRYLRQPRRRNPGVAQRGPPADAAVRGGDAARIAAALPGRGVLLSAGRHGDADP